MFADSGNLRFLGDDDGVTVLWRALVADGDTLLPGQLLRVRPRRPVLTSERKLFANRVQWTWSLPPAGSISMFVHEDLDGNVVMYIFFI